MVLELKFIVLFGGDLRFDFRENFFEFSCVWGEKL